ncbi:MAG: rhomboid family intramembrane serine protease [Flavobacteriales bacterium AspAUS03]
MNINTVVWVILIITLIISIKGFDDYAFFERYKFKISSILKGNQYDRLFTSGFLHVGWVHLLFNMVTLYFFGNSLIYAFSVQIFMIIYLGAILSGSLATLYFSRKDSQYSAVGASGGVSGVIYSAIVLTPQLELFIFPLPILIPGWIFAIVYMYYSIFGMQNQWGNLGHSAHLGGAIFGLLITVLLRPELIFVHGLYIILMLVPIVYVIFTEIRGG